MNTTNLNTAAVAIVGGGPVGLMLAMFLDQHQVPVVVFNSEYGSRWHPKGSTHNSRTMEHYRRVGIAEAVRRLGLPVDHPRDIAYFTRLTGWELARLHMPSERQRMQDTLNAPDIDQVPEPLLRVNQMYVERHMLNHAGTRSNIALRFGWRVTGFEQDEAGVTLTAVAIDDPEEVSQWRVAYLVGCDGGQSFVRRSLGIRYEGPGGASDRFLGGRMISSHVRIPALHRDLLTDRKAWMYNIMAPGARMLLISLDGKDEFLLMWQAQDLEQMPDDAAVIQRIQEGIGRRVDVEVVAHAPWQGGVALVAERFAERRVYLAGDATHLFSPTGGFGMNTGIDGAANLAWKLAAAVQGWAGDSLLASYEVERRPVALRNTAAARFLTQRIGGLEVPEEVEASDAHGAAARQRLGAALQVFRGQFSSIGVELGARYDGSPIVWSDGEPPADDPLEYRPTSIPGGRLPHLWLRTADGGRRSVFDLLHTGFTVLRIGVNSSDFDPGGALCFSEAAEARGIPLRVVDVASDSALALYRCRLILVRPDQHIAWRGDHAPVDAGVVLDRVVGRK